MNLTGELCAFLVGVLAGTIIVVGLFVAWIGQHNDLKDPVTNDSGYYSGSAEVIGIEPSASFVAPDMSLDMALDASAKTREENERGWGELRNDGTVVIHSAPFVASGDTLVNAAPIQVRLQLHTADPGVTDEQAEYANAAYTRKSASWSSASADERIDAVAFGWPRSANDFYSAAQYLEYWRALGVNPFDLGRLIGRHKHQAEFADTPMRTEPDNGLWHEWTAECANYDCVFLLPSELDGRERAPS